MPSPFLRCLVDTFWAPNICIIFVEAFPKKTTCSKCAIRSGHSANVETHFQFLFMRSRLGHKVVGIFAVSDCLGRCYEYEVCHILSPIEIQLRNPIRPDPSGKPIHGSRGKSMQKVLIFIN